jgi:hypothetical protein
MTAPGNSTLVFSLLAVLVACTGYAAGRLHQWYQTGRDRDEAYRDGYDTGTRSTFSMAARMISPRREKAIRASASVHASAAVRRDATSPPDAADGVVVEEPQAGGKSHGRGRHFVPEEFMRAVTYRLTPDRVARAKVKRSLPSPRPTPESARPARKASPKPAPATAPEAMSPMPKP